MKTEHTMQINHDPEFQSIRSTRTKKKCSSHDTLNSKFYQILTSNRYDVLSACPEHQCEDYSQTVHQYTTDQGFRTNRRSRKNAKSKLRSKTSITTHSKNTSFHQLVLHNQHIQETNQEIFTIPTLLNGVTNKTSSKTLPSNYNVHNTEIKLFINNLMTSIKEQNMCIQASDSAHRVYYVVIVT